VRRDRYRLRRNCFGRGNVRGKTRERQLGGVRVGRSGSKTARDPLERKLSVKKRPNGGGVGQKSSGKDLARREEGKK